MENFLHVTIIANGRALVEYLIAKVAHHLLFIHVKELPKSFIDFDNAKLPVINGKGIGNAVKNPGEEFFIVGAHLCLPIQLGKTKKLGFMQIHSGGRWC
jgi:hypothetical protein